MSLTICSCVDSRCCCICAEELRGESLAVLREEGDEVHVYCLACGKDTAVDEDVVADERTPSYWQKLDEYELGED